jgi:hypothetical protein
MSDDERDQLRQLQDTWLALPTVQAQIRGWGWGHSIATRDAPTFAEVRDTLLPDWRWWFADYIGDVT